MNRSHMPNGNSGTKASPPRLLIRASDRPEPSRRLSWPLAVLTMACLSLAGWVGVVYCIEWFTGG